jgi:hypothetical protein
VIDFGVAKATNQPLTEKTMFTQFGQIVGTLEYMSPEQAQFNQLDIDTRSDIYSLGVLLYELIVSETPFDGARLRSSAFEEVLRILREEEPPRPSHRVSTLGAKATQVSHCRSLDAAKLGSMLRGDLDWIVMKALDKDRKRRYDSPIEFARDIDCYLAHEPVVARPPTLPYRLSKYARRHWVTLSVASSLVFLLTIGLAFMWSLFMEKQAALAENQAALSQKQAILAKYRGEIESNVLDVLLTGATDVSELMDDAREAESSSATLAWFQALDHLNRDQRDEAVEKLKKLQETESELTVAAHATLVSAYYEAGKLTEYYIELESLLKREPVSYADRLMLGEALQWSDYKRTELYLREAVKERDNPLARTRCARSIAVAAMLQQNSQLASEATDFIQVAEIMAPDLPIVNDTSVFVHHIGMLYSDGCEQERH